VPAPPTLHAATLPELTSTTLYALLRLRVDVFVVEQRCPYPELDGRDVEASTVHLWLEHDGTPVAYLRILREPDGAARIGRVVVPASVRGAGHAVRLLEAALDVVDGRECVLDSQAHLVGFYARFGFRRAGDEFYEDGIPHVPMRRPAPPATAPSATATAPQRVDHGVRGGRR
jgi:ElaA protein